MDINQEHEMQEVYDAAENFIRTIHPEKLEEVTELKNRHMKNWKDRDKVVNEMKAELLKCLTSHTKK